MRYFLSCLAGMVASLGIFLMMTYLIDKPEPIVNPKKTPPIHVDVPKIKQPDRNVTAVEKVEYQEVTPRPISDPVTFVESEIQIRIPVTNEKFVLGTEGIKVDIQEPIVDQSQIERPEMTLLVGSKVKYPKKAEERKLEGYVVIENTIDMQGRVIDVRVIESSNSVFEQAARKAVYKWKYSQSKDEERYDKRRIAFKLD